MKVIKVLLAVLASLVALLVLVGVYIAWLFDPNDYKGYLTEFVAERTGRSFEIADDLELSLFPWIAIETGGVTLGNAPGFGTQPFATVERVSARIKLLPLLRREVEIGTIVLDGLELDLARTEDNDNWSDLLSRTAPSEATEPAAADAPRSFEVEGVRIRGSRAIWREDGTEVRYILSNLDLDTGVIGTGFGTDFELSFGLRDVGSELEVDVETAGRLELGTELRMRDLRTSFVVRDGRGQERVTGELELAVLAARDAAVDLGELLITARVDEPPLGGGSVDVRVALENASYDPGTQSLSTTGLHTEIDELGIDWELRGEAMLDDPQLAGALRLSPAPLASLFGLLAVPVPDGLGANALGNVGLSAAFRSTVASGRIAIDNVDAELLGLRARGSAALEGSERAAARIEIGEFQVNAAARALLASWLPEDIDAAAFERLALKGTVTLDLKTGDTTFDDFEAGVLDARLTGDLRIATTPAGRVISGKVASSRFAPEAFVAAFGAILTDTVNARELGPVSFDTEFTYDAGADLVRLEPLAIEVFGLAANGRLTASRLSATPSFVGHAEVREFAPRDLMRRFGQEPPQTSDDTALRRVRISTDFDLTSALGRFDALVVELDDSRITGNFRVDDFENPSYRFTLAADRLDVDRYLPPRADEAEAGERVAGDIEISSEGLHALNISGQARVGSLELAGMSFQQVSTELVVGAGKADIQSARAELYGGKFEGTFNVDSTGELASMSLSGQATNLALEPLLTDLAGDSSLSGTGSFDLRLSGRGTTITDNLRSAAGTMSFALREGVLTGFNLGRSLCQVYNLQQGLPAPPKLPTETRYELIQGSATVTDGIAATQDLLARASFMDITGRGRLAFVDQGLNYDLESTLTKSLGIANCESMDRMIGDSFPWTLSGTLTEPTILPDFSKYLQRRIENELRERTQQRLEDRVRERLQNLR